MTGKCESKKDLTLWKIIDSVWAVRVLLGLKAEGIPEQYKQNSRKGVEKSHCWVLI